METRGDGGGGSITSENVALEHPRVFVSRHVGKIPATQEEHVNPPELTRVKLTECASNICIANTPFAKSVVSGSMKPARPPRRVGHGCTLRSILTVPVSVLTCVSRVSFSKSKR